MVISGSSVAGKNARKAQPVYNNWRAVRRLSSPHEVSRPSLVQSLLSLDTPRPVHTQTFPLEPLEHSSEPFQTGFIPRTNKQQITPMSEPSRPTNPLSAFSPTAQNFFSSDLSIPNTPSPVVKEALASHILNPNTWVAEAQDPHARTLSFPIVSKLIIINKHILTVLHK